MKFLDSNGLTYFWQRVKSTIEEEIAAIPSDSGLPAGSIVIWSGAAAAIPEGWALCAMRTKFLRLTATLQGPG